MNPKISLWRIIHMNHEREGNSKIKIGSRVLSESSLGILLPQYEEIQKDIENMRSFATRYANDIKEQGQGANQLWKEYRNNVNNVISVLGGRGSGKTSVLLTVKHRISSGKYDIDEAEKENGNQLDIVLPTILPETMSEDSDLLGWILGAFSFIVEDLEKGIYEKKQYAIDEHDKDFYENCRRKEKNSIRVAYDKVITQYRYTKPDYKKIMQDQYEGFINYVEKSKKILEPQNQLIVAFHEFIDEIIRIKKKMKDMDCEKEPLVFIFIDDVDLSFERCEEVLNVMLRYLSYPNIVTFVAGDYSKFKEVLLVNYLNRMNLIDLLTKANSESNYEAEIMLNNNKILVEDNLKKILPPSLRYNLQKYQYDRRFEFKYEFNDDMITLIKKCFYIAEDRMIPKSYGVIFDAYPRGLMNVYYSICHMLQDESQDNNEVQTEEHIEWLKRTIGKRLELLIQVMIRSSSVLNQYESYILNCIHIDTNEYNKSWIDYIRVKYIPITVSSSVDENREEAINQERMRIYTLCNFIEKLLIDSGSKLWKSINRSLHGGNIIYEYINSNSTLSLYPKCKELPMVYSLFHRLTHCEALLSLKRISNLHVRHDSFIQYFTILEDTMNEFGMRKAKFMNTILNTDTNWCRQIFEIIYEHQDPIILSLNEAIGKVKAELKAFNQTEKLLQDVQNELNKNNLRKFDQILKIYRGIISNEMNEEIRLPFIEARYQDLKLRLSFDKGTYYIDDTYFKGMCHEIRNLLKIPNINNRYDSSLGKFLKKRKLTETEKSELIELIEQLKKQSDISEEELKVVKESLGSIEVLLTFIKDDNKIIDTNNYNIDVYSVVYTIIKTANDIVENIQNDYCMMFKNWDKELANCSPYKRFCERNWLKTLVQVVDDDVQ